MRLRLVQLKAEIHGIALDVVWKNVWGLVLNIDQKLSLDCLSIRSVSLEHEENRPRHRRSHSLEIDRKTLWQNVAIDSDVGLLSDLFVSSLLPDFLEHLCALTPVRFVR